MAVGNGVEKRIVHQTGNGQRNTSRLARGYGQVHILKAETCLEEGRLKCRFKMISP